MPISASQLRADVYNLIDRVIETGEPLEIERKGVVVQITPPKPVSKLNRLAQLPGLVVVGDSDDFVSWDWSSEWKPGDS
jgi:antitoxin (DNA-binding transcriptional repressor) of toxin-antitoxin stability system